MKFEFNNEIMEKLAPLSSFNNHAGLNTLARS